MPSAKLAFPGKNHSRIEVCDFFFKTINCCPKNIIGQSTEREFHESAQIVIIAYV